MIEARIESDFPTNGHKVWIFERERGSVRVYYSRRGHDYVEGPWVESPQGVDPEASFFLPDGALEALMYAGQQIVRSSDATIDALHDARDVRDRMIALVEKRWMEDS